MKDKESLNIEEEQNIGGQEPLIPKENLTTDSHALTEDYEQYNYLTS